VSVSVLQGLRDVAGNYDGFVLDLWGVVHDGVTVFPGVVDALQQLHAAGKKLVFLSNAPRRAHMVAAQLDGFGITASLHDGVMSSGEATWRYLHDRPDDWARELGPTMPPWKDSNSARPRTWSPRISFWSQARRIK